MGIKFFCHACDRKLNVKSFLAGKRGICPHCGERVRIPHETQLDSAAPTAPPTSEPNPDDFLPQESENEAAASPVATTTAAASVVTPTATPTATPRTAPVATPVAKPAAAPAADPIADNPDGVWYVRPPSGGQFGPADGEIMRRWIGEGRVSADSLVWCEGWDDWKKAGPLFPSLGKPTPPEPTSVASNPAVKIDTNGAATSPGISTAKEKSPSAGSSTASKYTARRKSSKGMGIAIVSVLGLLIVALAVILIVIVANK